MKNERKIKPEDLVSIVTFSVSLSFSTAIRVSVYSFESDLDAADLLVEVKLAATTVTVLQLLVLKYIKNRDVFMRYHKTQLTRRLVLNTSADSEKEENMVEWLRVGGRALQAHNTCGSQMMLG